MKERFDVQIYSFKSKVDLLFQFAMVYDSQSKNIDNTVFCHYVVKEFDSKRNVIN